MVVDHVSGFLVAVKQTVRNLYPYVVLASFLKKQPMCDECTAHDWSHIYSELSARRSCAFGYNAFL